MVTANRDSALLNAIMTAAPDAILVADATGTIRQANPAAAVLFGYGADEMIGHKVNMLMPADMAHQHDGFMQRYMDTGEARIIGIGRDVEGRRKDGTTFPLHLSVGETALEGQRLFVGILHDQTPRKAAEQALARSQRLDAIGQMTGGISHDFNNLLTIIIGNLELLQMRQSEGKDAALIEDALESAQLGADLTSRLLVFARRSNLKPRELDLREVCDQALSILSRTLGAPYKIQTNYAPDVARVVVDPAQLQAALMNLVLNARDAMPDGGQLLISIANVTIDDRYMAQETDMAQGHYVRLEVSDDGEGMEQEAQRRAFEPFFTTKSNLGGTGLGLAQVYGFVRQSGGHITLYSEPGLGTSFGLYFPVAQPGAVAEPQSVPPHRHAAAADGDRTVLVVEDNPRVRKLSVQRITDLGYEVLEASTGDAAYEMLRDGQRIDCVFTDLVMPGTLNGYDLAIRIAEEFPAVRVLLTSGYASDVIASKMPTGANGAILHKPYRLSDLSARLRSLFADPNP